MSSEITLLKDSNELDVSFSYGAFCDICQRAEQRARIAGRIELANEFKFGIQMRELYFWYASDSDRRFFINVLREILAEDDFFTWPAELPDPDVVYCHPDGTTSRPLDPRAVVKRGSLLGVTRLIQNLETLLQNSAEHLSGGNGGQPSL